MNFFATQQFPLYVWNHLGGTQGMWQHQPSDQCACVHRTHSLWGRHIRHMVRHRALVNFRDSFGSELWISAADMMRMRDQERWRREIKRDEERSRRKIKRDQERWKDINNRWIIQIKRWREIKKIWSEMQRDEEGNQDEINKADQEMKRDQKRWREIKRDEERSRRDESCRSRQMNRYQ